jgi:hypothetical protein
MHFFFNDNMAFTAQAGYALGLADYSYTPSVLAGISFRF